MTIKVLGRSLLNPTPDLRRSARDFRAVALWPAGTVFAEIGGDVFVEWSPRGRFRCVALTGVQAEILRRQLRDPNIQDAVEALLRDGPQWALDVLHEARPDPEALGNALIAAVAAECED